ncbi:peptidoglycan-binding protein [Trichothermofontia sp.]
MLQVAIPLTIALNPAAYGQNPSAPSPSLASERPGLGGEEVPIVQRATLQVGSEGSDVLELQATLKLLGFYGGEVSGRYDEQTAAAVTQFQQAAGLPADGVMRPESWRRLFPSLATLSSPLAAPSAPQVAPVPESAASPPSSQVPIPSGGSESVPITPNATTSGSGGEAAAVLDPASTASSTPNPHSTSTPTTAVETPAPPPATAAAATQSFTPPPIDLPILRQGMHGPAVVQLQERLRTIGVFNGAIDGVFGPETQAAVKAAQSKFQIDPDGVVGPVTWAVLLR